MCWSFFKNDIFIDYIIYWFISVKIKIKYVIEIGNFGFLSLNMFLVLNIYKKILITKICNEFISFKLFFNFKSMINKFLNLNILL